MCPMLLPRATGTGRRAEVGELALASIGRFCRNIPAAVVDIEMMGPPDIEQRVVLRGGHIFQAECLSGHMWDRRLGARTPT